LRFLDTYKPLGLLFVALFSWLVAVGFLQAIDFTVVRSDVKSYWIDSLALGDKIHPFHQPGWPFLISIGHWLFPMLSPALLMQLLALFAWLSSIVLVYTLLNGLVGGTAWYGALLFGLYPLTGLSGTVYPLSDALAGLTIVFCLWAYVEKKRAPLIIGIAFGLMVHKALWPMLGLLALVSIRDKRLSVPEVLLSGTPLLVYWLIGGRYFSDYLWIVRSNVEVEVASRSAVPFFDGFYSTIREWSPKSILKFSILLSVFALATWLLLMPQFLRKHPVFLSTIVPILLMGIMLNGHEIWAMVRFSKLLIIPLWVVLDQRRWQIGFLNLKPMLGTATILAFFSNLIFLYYMEFIYF